MRPPTVRMFPGRRSPWSTASGMPVSMSLLHRPFQLGRQARSRLPSLSVSSYGDPASNALASCATPSTSSACCRNVGLRIRHCSAQHPHELAVSTPLRWRPSARANCCGQPGRKRAPYLSSCGPRKLEARAVSLYPPWPQGRMSSAQWPGRLHPNHRPPGDQLNISEWP
jgi:hypothetical protein